MSKCMREYKQHNHDSLKEEQERVSEAFISKYGEMQSGFSFDLSEEEELKPVNKIKPKF